MAFHLKKTTILSYARNTIILKLPVVLFFPLKSIIVFFLIVGDTKIYAQIMQYLILQKP